MTSLDERQALALFSEGVRLPLDAGNHSAPVYLHLAAACAEGRATTLSVAVVNEDGAPVEGSASIIVMESCGQIVARYRDERLERHVERRHRADERERAAREARSRVVPCEERAHPLPLVELPLANTTTNTATTERVGTVCADEDEASTVAARRLRRRGVLGYLYETDQLQKKEKRGHGLFGSFAPKGRLGAPAFVSILVVALLLVAFLMSVGRAPLEAGGAHAPLRSPDEGLEDVPQSASPWQENSPERRLQTNIFELVDDSPAHESASSSVRLRLTGEWATHWREGAQSVPPQLSSVSVSVLDARGEEMVGAVRIEFVDGQLAARVRFPEAALPKAGSRSKEPAGARLGAWPLYEADEMFDEVRIRLRADEDEGSLRDSLRKPGQRMLRLLREAPPDSLE